MSLPEPDTVAALVAFLMNDSGVQDAIDGRVFGGELPSSEQAHQPRGAIVIKPAGGTGTIGQAFQEYGDGRVDVFCYGATPHDAHELWRQINPLMKQLRRRTFAYTLLHWARPSAGQPTQQRDPDTDWPYCLLSYQVMAAGIPNV